MSWRSAAWICACLVSAPAAAGPPSDDPTRAAATARLAEAVRHDQQRLRAEQAAQQALAASAAQEAAQEQARDREAAALRAVDARVQDAAIQLTRATEAQTANSAALDRTRASFVALLPAMLRVSQYPAQSVLVVPASPVQAQQGLSILRGLAIVLDRQAGQLRDAEAASASATRGRAQAVALLAAAQTDQRARATALDRVVAQARARVDAAEADGRQAALQVAQAAARTRTLRDAIAAMDAEAARQADQSARDAAAAERRHQDAAAGTARARHAAVTRPPGPAPASGQWTPPVAGDQRQAFGASTPDGPATGITYAAVPGATVSAPCAGRIGFAAPFRSYGKLVILECAGGADLVLAGLGSLAASPGHAVRQSEMLGRMPDAVTGRMPNGAKPDLYIEMRSGGRTIDPAPFLKAKT